MPDTPAATDLYRLRTAGDIALSPDGRSAVIVVTEIATEDCLICGGVSVVKGSRVAGAMVILRIGREATVDFDVVTQSKRAAASAVS
jgi:hypothetical protein